MTESKRRRARILFLNSRADRGGASVGMLNIVSHLDPEWFEPIVVLPGEGMLTEALTASGITVRRLDVCRLERLASPSDIVMFIRRFVASTRALRRIVLDEQIDLIYTNSSAIPVGAWVAKLTRLPNIWHIREIWTSPRWLTKLLYCYIYLLADRIIAITRAVALGNFGRDDGKIAVIRIGNDPSRFKDLESRSAPLRKRLGLSEAWPVVTTAARIVPLKGLDCFIEAARIVRDSGINAYFCIAGDVPRPMYQEYKDRLMAQISASQLEDRVRMLGWVDDIPAFLYVSDLCVLASVGTEGAGRIIPEAWLAGTPVVAPNHSGPGEMVEHGRNGLLFQAGNAQDLAGQISRILMDPDHSMQMAEAGRQHAMIHHDAIRNTAAIQKIMSELLDRYGRV